MDKVQSDFLVKAVIIGIGGYIVVTYGAKIIDDIKNGLKPGDSADDTASVLKDSTDPNSPWSNQFWHNAPVGSAILTQDAANLLSNGIYATETWYADDFGGALGLFKQLKTQSQVSFLAEYFNNLFGSDLLAFLIGTTWPSDGFSSTQVNTIKDYVKGLPKYKA